MATMEELTALEIATAPKREGYDYVPMTVGPNTIYHPKYVPKPNQGRGGLRDWYGNPVDVTTPTPNAPARGFTNVPGYEFGGNIQTIQAPEAYKDKGWIADESKKQESIELSDSAVALLSPKDQEAYIENKIGKRPGYSDTITGLVEQGVKEFTNKMAAAGSYPTQSQLADIRDKLRKDKRIIDHAKANLGEYDAKRKQFADRIKAVTDNEKAKNAALKDATKQAQTLIDRLPAEQRKAVKEKVLAALYKAVQEGGPDMQLKIFEALNDIPDVETTSSINAKKAKFLDTTSDEVPKPSATGEKISVEQAKKYIDVYGNDAEAKAKADGWVF